MYSQSNDKSAPAFLAQKDWWKTPEEIESLKAKGVGIRLVFRVTILLVVMLAFLVVVNISYTNVTTDERSRAEASILSEVNYLCLQLGFLNERAEAFEELVDESDIALGNLTTEEAEAYRLLSNPIEDLLIGYTLEETGVVMILTDGTVLMSDDPRLAVGADVRELLGTSVGDAIDASLQSDELQTIACEGMLSELVRGDKGGYLLARQQDEYTVVIIESDSLVFRDRIAVMSREIMVTLIVLLLVSLVVERLLTIMVARRIDKMNAALERITSGDLDVRVEDEGTREFKSLSYGINGTVDALKGLISEIESSMDEELATAKAIQESALPRIFPPFPDLPKFDIYASMDAARQVGGDFYDFFLVGDNCTAESGKLAFAIADVSGKGVPAALFMMKAKALIRDYVQSGLELGEAVTEANRQICDGNDAGMFVTAWIGLLDYGTGHVDYVNAGHNPPLLWQRDGGWRWMREKSGPVLGLFEMPYTARSVDCKACDTFLLYTDGVTEAFDANDRLYGEERLMDLAKSVYQLHPRELLAAVREDVGIYAQGAEQSDDITILALEVGVPPEVTATIEVLAEIGELDRVNEFLHDELDRRMCPKRVQNQLDIIVEELFVNVCSYAYPDKASSPAPIVRVQRTYSAEPPCVTVEMIDRGIPFDPLAKPEAVAPKSAEEVPVGGLGIFMTKKLADEMRYERIDDANVVTVVKKW